MTQYSNTVKFEIAFIFLNKWLLQIKPHVVNYTI